MAGSAPAKGRHVGSAAESGESMLHLADVVHKAVEARVLSSRSQPNPAAAFLQGFLWLTPSGCLLLSPQLEQMCASPADLMVPKSWGHAKVR